MIVGVLTDIATGGTFLSWSIHFLKNDREYYRCDPSKWTSLPMNPLTKKNAHLFKPNQICYTSEHGLLEKQLTELKAIDCNNLQIYYIHPLTDKNTGHLCKLSTTSSVNMIQNVADKTIVLSLDPTHSFYYYHANFREFGLKFSNLSVKNQTNEEQINEFYNYYFSESIDLWGKSLEHMTIWDLREFYALNIRPYEMPSDINQFIDNNNKPLAIDAFEFYRFGENTMRKIFNFLELEITPTRLNEWRPVYKQWQTFHRDKVQFTLEFDQIIENIISGNTMDLSVYKLDIIKESVILHELLYKHNLNIRGYQVEKFVNTKQIHSLLETNTIHNVNDIYGVLNK